MGELTHAENLLLNSLRDTTRDAPKFSGQIYSETHLTGRQIRLYANKLIEAGYPVVSVSTEEPRGYFIARSWDDLVLGTRHLRSRLKCLSHRIKQLEDIGSREFGAEQMELWREAI
ncbi:MAG: hypothetical protein PHT33_06850 [bacterium]|nr:hypothetical protein [bacterium]